MIHSRNDNYNEENYEEEYYYSSAFRGNQKDGKRLKRK